MEAQAVEGVAPQQGGRPAEHRAHAVPAHTPLPRGLLVLKALDLLEGGGGRGAFAGQFLGG